MHWLCWKHSSLKFPKVGSNSYLSSGWVGPGAVVYLCVQVCRWPVQKREHILCVRLMWKWEFPFEPLAIRFICPNVKFCFTFVLFINPFSRHTSIYYYLILYQVHNKLKCEQFSDICLTIFYSGLYETRIFRGVLSEDEVECFWLTSAPPWLFFLSCSDDLVDCVAHRTFPLSISVFIRLCLFG